MSVERARELLAGTIRADHESEEARTVIAGLLGVIDGRPTVADVTAHLIERRKVEAERDEALVRAGVERARADKANRRLANFTTRINDQLTAEVQRQKANALREAADSLAPDVRRGAPIHPTILVAALHSRADKLDPPEVGQ